MTDTTHADAISNAIMSALTVHALKSMGKDTVLSRPIEPDQTLLDRMRSEYTFVFANGEFELVRKA